MAYETKEVTAPGTIQREGWSRPELSRRIYLIPHMLGIRQKRFGKDQMRIKAKTIKNILLLFLKQDPKAFKEICKWYWIDVNVVGKKQMHNGFFSSFSQCEFVSGCMFISGFRI